MKHSQLRSLWRMWRDVSGKAWVGLLVLALSTNLSGCHRAPEVASNAASSASSTTSVVNAPAQVAASSAASTTEVAAEPAPDTETTETGTTTVASNGLSLRFPEAKADGVSPKWIEGQHYVRITPAGPTSTPPGKIEVLEFFWYGCPHCYALDPTLETWRTKQKPAYMELVRVPILWSPTHGMHARVFYVAKLLGKLDDLHSSIFAEFNAQHHPLNSVDEVRAFFVKNGVDADAFNKTLTSPQMDAALTNAQSLAMRYKVDSVPTVVVNGKYLTDVGRAGGHEQLVALINDLAASEHR